MRKTLFIIISILFNFSSFSQKVQEKYFGKGNEYVIILSDNRIEFLLENIGDFGIERKIGTGNYKLRKGIYKIKVNSHNKKFDSKFFNLENAPEINENTIQIIVENEKGERLPYSGINLVNTSGTKTEIISDIEGVAIIDEYNNQTSYIEANYVAHSSILIPIGKISSNRIKIVLNEGCFFLDNKMIFLKINFLVDEKFEYEILKIK